ncbi:serine/threonine-protein phosphatase CPPED1 isoform X2 [Panthera tigris]|uniref:serine/threonine-protein phosphatase CPPED1 isoform X2 n=1 Tax=Panthera tigris TaxID=9694 RepID=UPI001C6FA61C|nr:serine/threonine-protein phosphatase CPPED1 isoform X2 [Panthera tigris]
MLPAASLERPTWQGTEGSFWSTASKESSRQPHKCTWKQILPREREWKGPFYFIQGADPQFGLMKAWSTGNCDSGGDEWGQEIRLTEQAVQAVNKLKPRPRFFVLCGDLIHAMPGTPWRKEQTADLQRVLARVDSDIPLVLVSGNHDLGNAPTPETVAEFQRTWGDDYFSFWVGGVLCLVLNSQFWYDASRCPALKQAQDQWLDQQLSVAGQRECQHAIVFQHIPLFLQSIDEDDDYFNLTKSVRREVADKLVRAGTVPKSVVFPACSEPVLRIKPIISETHSDSMRDLLASLFENGGNGHSGRDLGKRDPRLGPTTVWAGKWLGVVSSGVGWLRSHGGSGRPEGRQGRGQFPREDHQLTFLRPPPISVAAAPLRDLPVSSPGWSTFSPASFMLDTLQSLSIPRLAATSVYLPRVFLDGFPV